VAASSLPPVVGFSGGRALSGPPAALVGRVASAVLAAGSPVFVGCSLGADREVLSALLAAPSSPAVSASRVFAAFGPAGAGAASSSAVRAVCSLAPAGVPVLWWSGGGPAVPLRGRLAARSLALVRALAADGGSLFVFPSGLPPAPFGPGPFPSCGGSGSWSSAAAAALLGVPVVVLAASWAGWRALPALPGPAGFLWSAVLIFGVPGFAWSPVVGSPCLPGFAPAGVALEA